ncbi:MAG TPA: AAA family ATPase [Candidatus Eisenbacteria bacterium]
MKLLRLRADSFGAFKGEISFEPGKVAVIVDENERGKSTLLAAVSAALYGLDGDKRHWPILTPLDRWRPWTGEGYAVELEIESKGERLTVRRDFARGTTEVWNGRGQEITFEYREGKDQFPVGKKLLGLDVEEFEKCAFVRQTELEHVVPAEEKARRANTLQARLENAADTRGGDTNATEAMQLLENATKKYTCQELDFTGTIDNAVQRLEAKRGVIETEVKNLEHELAKVAGPLEELSKLGEEEAGARLALARVSEERKGALASELKKRMAEDDERRGELQRLEAEAKDLAASAHVPDNAEGELSQTVGQLEQAQRNLDALESRHRDEQARERATLEAELVNFQTVASATAADADRLIALAAEMRRVADEDGRRRSEISDLREQLAGKGIDQERQRTLNKRFDSLDDKSLQLLRGQSEVGLVYQSDLGTLETQRTEGTESLRAIDAQRGGLRVPGWLLVTLGFGAGIAGGALVAMRAEARLWAALLSGGSVLVFVGVVLLIGASAVRRRERAEALRKLSDAQRRISILRTRRGESETALGELALSLGYKDPIELMRDWNEYSRVNDQNQPVRLAQEQLVALETARRSVFEDSRSLLDRFGGGLPEPGRLERVANDIRGLVRLRERIEGLDKNWAWVGDEKRSASAEVAGHKEKALRVLQSAGLVFDPEKPWAEHLKELAERVRGKARLGLLRGELIPQAQKRVMPESQRGEIKTQLDSFEAEAGEAEAGGDARRSPLDLERETRRLQERLDEIQRKRGEIKAQVDVVCRRYESEHPEKLQHIERLDRALGRARRFKRAIELAGATIKQTALEAHKRWAEFLNQRVAEVLEQVGARVEELRFGEDLDFSVKLWNGQQLSRGKAVGQLSTGARDQLYLAIRLAISEYLSPEDEPLPLLVDDVFATSDDQRARAGMRLLIEHFGQRHQVVIVSCHRHRLESLSRLDPDLYKARVQWLDTRSTNFVR